MAPFEALYGRRCRSPMGWFESTEPRPRGTDLIQEALDQVRVIQDRLRTARSRHQSYADRRGRPLRFSVGDRVFLLVSPMKGVMRFGRRGKLSPRYIGPFEILRTVGEVAYELTLPLAFSAIHPVFHVSMLRRYVPDESHVLQYDVVELDEHLTFVEEQVAILARDVRRLRSKAIPVVKVRWRHRLVEEATWETEQEMREQFSACLNLQALPFGQLWVQEFGVPIFGSLSVNPPSGNAICCMVDGSVVALDTEGSVVWKVSTTGPIFAGPCISRALPLQVLICSRDGSVYSFDLEKGDLFWKHDVGHPITSSAYVDEHLLLSCKDSSLSQRLVCVCSSSGSVHVLQVSLNFDGEIQPCDMVREFARFELGGDVFSSPVMIGGEIFVGCRDDYMHCIRLQEEIPI